MALWLGCAIVPTACGRKSGTPRPDPIFQLPFSAVELATLPPPTALQNKDISAGAVVRLSGSAHDPALPAQRATDSGALLDLDPAYPLSGASGHAGLALALYRFNATGYSGAAEFRCRWASPPEDGTAWLGLGDMAADRWRWQLLPATWQRTVNGGLGPYTAPGGDVLAVLAVTGTANPCTLEYLRLGNEPPAAKLLASSVSGPLPLDVAFDATGSSDADGAVTSMELDYGDGHGFQPLPAGGLAQFSYTLTGNYAATLRVTDNEGATGTASLQINAGGAANQLPVAKLSLSSASALPGSSVLLDAQASSDADGTIVQYEFDPEGDGTFLIDRLSNGSLPQYTHQYNTPGLFHPAVRVTDDAGATATASQTLTVSYGSLAHRTLDATPGSGEYVNLGIANGRLCAAYRLNGDLAFIRATTPDASAFTAPALLGILDYGLSLADMAGMPGIAFNSSDKLILRMASNADGSAWYPPVTVMQGSNQPGTFPGLAMVSGKPAVIGTDGTQIVSWYIHAQNALGTSWHPRVALNSSLKSFTGNLLVLPNGCPCAAATKMQGLGSSGGVFFTASDDTAGQNWPTPLTIHNSVDYPAYCGALQLVAGRPAVAFHDDTTDRVRFQRAKDAEGAEWNNAVAAAPLSLSNSLTGQFLSMAVVNGLPAIAYADPGLGVQLVLARTPAGSSWNAPVAVDSTAADAHWIALTAYGSRPAVAYAVSGGLRLALWH
jgi:hypothetical protein